MWPRGAMDKASVYGTEDCRFESCRGRVGHYTSTSIAVILLWRRISTLENILVFVGNDSEFISQPETVCDPKIVKHEKYVAAWRNGQRVGLRNRRLQVRILPWSCWTLYKHKHCCDTVVATNLHSRKHILVFVGNDSELPAQPETVCDPKSFRTEKACGRVAQWTTRRSTEPKIAGSNPAVVVLDIIQAEALL
uniref:Uncharacterized protein n=1 Tax=Parascaris univalens TaxID=6257 RepID=A0A915CLM5_PARUN